MPELEDILNEEQWGEGSEVAGQENGSAGLESEDVGSAAESELEESDIDDSDDEDIFAFLEGFEEDGAAEGDEPEAAPVAEEKKPELEVKEPVPSAAAESQTDEFPAEVVPGTLEYASRIATEAEEQIKKMFKVDEYDSLDPKQQAAFNVICRKLDQKAEQFYEEKKAEVENFKTVSAAKATAETEIETILNTPELVAKFDDAMEDMPFRQRKALVAEAGKGNFAGFLEVAKRIAGVKAKVASINNRAQEPARTARQVVNEPVEDPDSSGVAGMLGI